MGLAALSPFMGRLVDLRGHRGVLLPAAIVSSVPLVVIGFLAMRRNTAAGELAAGDDAQARALVEREFAEAEAYQAKWHEEDNERYHQERLP